MSLVRIYTASSTSPIVSLYGGAGDHEMILRYLDGWYSTPDAKMKLMERASGDGAHDVAESDIIYGTRTITVDYRILSDSRSRLLAHERELLSLAHQKVRFRVTDDDSDLFASGYVDSVVKDKSQQNLAQQTETGTLTVVCPRPERLSREPHRFQLFASHAADGATGVGLSYNQPGYITYAAGEPDKSDSVMVVGTNRGSIGLAYPLTYSGAGDVGVVASQAAGLLRNDGSSRAYPVFTCNGPFPNGVALDFPSLNASIECAQPVYGVPLVLDCRARSATVGGLDVSRRLKSRGFPSVAPGGTLSVVLRTGGSGWVDCSVHDTFM